MTITPERIGDLSTADAALRFQFDHETLTDAFMASQDVDFALKVLVTGPIGQAGAAVLVMCDMAEWAVGLDPPVDGWIADGLDIRDRCRVHTVIAATRTLMGSEIVGMAYPFSRPGYHFPLVDLEQFCDRLGRFEAMEAMVEAHWIAAVLDRAPPAETGNLSLEVIGGVADLLILNHYYGRRVWAPKEARRQLVNGVTMFVAAVRGKWDQANGRGVRPSLPRKAPSTDVLATFRRACQQHMITRVQ